MHGSFHLLPAILISSLEKRLFRSVTYLGGKSAFLLLSFKSSLDMLGTNICQMCVCSSFSQCEALLLLLLFFILAQALCFDKIKFINFFLHVMLLVSNLRSLCLARSPKYLLEILKF